LSRRRVRIGAAVVVGLATCAAVPNALAEVPIAGGNPTPGGGTVIVVVPGSSGGMPTSGSSPTTGSGSTSPIVCGYYTDDGTPVDDPESFGLSPGDWVVLACSVDGQPVGARQRVQWFPGTPLPAPQPNAAELAQVALGRLAVPLPTVASWPAPGGTSLVNLPVWLHVGNWSQLTASASAGGLTATITAEPVRAAWNMDEGTVTCASAGATYEPSIAPDAQSTDCSFTYQHSSGIRTDGNFHASGTLVWHMRWSATNGQGGDLGEISRTSAFTMRVEESQALVVSAG